MAHTETATQTCENRTSTWQCDEPATEDMGDGKRFCGGCSSAAGGSGYDDREVDR